TIVRWTHHGPAQFGRRTWPYHKTPRHFKNNFKLLSPVSARIPAGPKSRLRAPRSLSGQRPFPPSKVCSAYAENPFGTDDNSLHQASGSKPCLRAPGAEQKVWLAEQATFSVPSSQKNPSGPSSPYSSYNDYATRTPMIKVNASTCNSPSKDANRRALCGNDQGRSVPLPQRFSL
ncbi:hypothetical protein Taro_028337, partial [Colocasia esculenta]|nr:hypothetical protein [Colocasia esculenta]